MSYIRVSLALIFLIWSPFLSAEIVQVKINQQVFKLKIAKTPKELSQGLMFQRHLPEQSGMLFIIHPKDAQFVSMWMKNTYIPLDMLFIDADNRILCISKNTKPQSLAPIGCTFPTTAVIEINAGEADKYAISVGMKVGSVDNSSTHLLPAACPRDPWIPRTSRGT